MGKLLEKLMAELKRDRTKRRLKAAFRRKPKPAIPFGLRAKELHEAFCDPEIPEHSGCDTKGADHA